MTEIHNWVWKPNVQTAIEHIALIVGYALDESDTQAIILGLETTDADEGRWYTYPVVGDTPIEVHVALNPGASPVDVKMVGRLSAVQEARISTVLAVLQDVRPG